MMKHLQKLGRALMLPVAVLPAAGLLMGVGYWIDPSGWGANSVIAAFLISSGKAIIDNLPIIFAVGLAYGLSEDKDGAASLSGLIGFLLLTTLLKSENVAMLQSIPLDQVDPGFAKINNAFIGIISGVVGAMMYNRFHKKQLPTALAFFSGKRLAPIMTSVIMMPIALILLYVWPVVYGSLVAFGTSISNLGPVGAGLFGFFNRLLIPTGLHHALNSVFWFDTIGINDIGNFWGSTGVKGVTGMYQAGFFPVMMFGLVGAALAMYQTAKPENKKTVGSLMLAAGFSAFFTGVTEPLEFAFMFVAPFLYFVHAVLTGISLFIISTLKWTAGFGFSAGFVDFILSSRLPLANNPYMILVFGVFYFFVYYAIFRVLIVKFNFMTPGREEHIEMDVEFASEERFLKQARDVLTALGGKENVVSSDYCTTRLRLELENLDLIDEVAIKKTGSAGIMKPGGQSVHVIIGTEVQFVADEFKKLLK
ncbi:N-acetylglucosamine-specific PTS transporter subunit IIBC [Erysipelothrix urinaevulpis]|uniref:N-acetylglucosamine-specific PTS transporter subunit IIBC n=1 Tax=Erysipelothrix urinaevulpis TaxID=2683717 RepID=UPI00135A239E|nr:N-acetylglucosamine-specific PTS transporter subunit IIBC [Erysipelothrix urinaevulpis]